MQLDADTTAALLEASDRLTNSLNTLVDELRRQLPERVRAAGLGSDSD